MPNFYIVPAPPIRRSAFALVLALVVFTAMSVLFVREVLDVREAMARLRQIGRASCRERVL